MFAAAPLEDKVAIVAGSKFLPAILLSGTAAIRCVAIGSGKKADEIHVCRGLSAATLEKS